MANAPLDRDVLASIGTDALVAHGFSELVIRQWRRRGISWKERPKVQRLAERKGIALPSDFLEKQRAASKPSKRTRRAA
jgi:hypothetical protein